MTDYKSENPPKYISKFNNKEIVKKLCNEIMIKIENFLLLGNLKINILDDGKIYYNRRDDIKHYLNTTILKHSGISLFEISCCGNTYTHLKFKSEKNNSCLIL